MKSRLTSQAGGGAGITGTPASGYETNYERLRYCRGADSTCHSSEYQHTPVKAPVLAAALRAQGTPGLATRVARGRSEV